MIARRVPFTGSTKSDVIVSILEREHPPLTRYAPEAPIELQRIVARALNKNKEERYRTAKDLLTDLVSLRQSLDLEARPTRSSLPVRSREMKPSHEKRQPEAGA